MRRGTGSKDIPPVKPPRSQHTLSELMGLVAVCAVGLALLTTRLAPIGIGVLIVLPGFVVGRVKGGSGLIGGIVSGCLIPMSLMTAWEILEYGAGLRTTAQMLDLFPALYLTFHVGLVWSFLASGVFYFLDRQLQGCQRSNRGGTGTDAAGIRFLPYVDVPRAASEASPGPGASRRRQGR
jgi:hypothetical protein